MAKIGQHLSLTLGFSLRAVAIELALVSTLMLTVASTQAALAQSFSVIHSFTGGSGGAVPYTGVVVDSGNLYGTTIYGGVVRNNCPNGCGIVFQLTPNENFKTIWQFAGYPTDGAAPLSGLIIGARGALYGATVDGGPSGGCGLFGEGGCGTVFELMPPSATPPRTVRENNWTESVIYNAPSCCSSLNYPNGDLAMDPSGNLYGAAEGDGGIGAVFELIYSNGTWNESTLYNSPSDTALLGGVSFDTVGNIYGTQQGCCYNGLVYQLLAGSDWAENTLYTFPGGADGCVPRSAVTFDPFGNMYGATSDCGENRGGVVYELLNGSWSYQSVYTFSGGGSGCGPYLSTLIFDQAGSLYGTTYCDGQAPPNNYGSVFKLTPSMSGWTYTSLHDFTGGSDGGYPVGKLAFDGNGNLYGTASCGGNTGNCPSGVGVVFKISGF